MSASPSSVNPTSPLKEALLLEAPSLVDVIVALDIRELGHKRVVFEMIVKAQRGDVAGALKDLDELKLPDDIDPKLDHIPQYQGRFHGPTIGRDGLSDGQRLRAYLENLLGMQSM